MGLVLKASIFCRPIRPKTILDFGCGRSEFVEALASRLGAAGHRYDPAIPQFSRLPVATADLVTNTDVLEHLDVSELDQAIADIRSISPNVFFNISTRVARTVLPNGENAHATVQSAVWWEERMKTHFPTVTRIPSAPDAVAFVTWDVPLRERASFFVWDGLARLRALGGSLARRIVGPAAARRVRDMLARTGW